MQNLTRILLVLVALSLVARFSGAWSAPQEPGKVEKLGQAPGGKRMVQQKARGEKQAAIRKALPTLKTTLTEAIALAEKEAGGKAFSASVELREGKPALVVNLFTEKSERPVIATIDPETKKVLIQEPPKKPAAEGAEGEDEEGG